MVRYYLWETELTMRRFWQEQTGAAMGSGADAAIEAADVVFMTSSVEAIPQSIQIARNVGRIAMQNVVFALAVKFRYDSRSGRICQYVDGCFCRHRGGNALCAEFYSDFVSKIRRYDEKSEEKITKILILVRFVPNG